MGNYKIEKTHATDMVPSNLLANTSPNLPPRANYRYLYFHENDTEFNKHFVDGFSPVGISL